MSEVKIFTKELKETKPGMLQLGSKELDELYEEHGAPKDVREAVRKATDIILLEAAKVAKSHLCSDACEEPKVTVRLGKGNGALEASVTGRKTVRYPDPDNKGETKTAVKFGVTSLKQQTMITKKLLDPVIEEIEADCRKAFK